jgi:transmembrane sensor
MKEGDSMDMDKIDQLAFRVAYLIAGFLQENLTEKEQEELDDWVGANMENQRLFEELTDPENLEKWIQWREKLPAAETLDRLSKRLEFTDKPRKSVIRSVWPYIAAAVIVVGVVVAIKWIPATGIHGNKDQPMANDIAPGTNRARLTLSNGTIILLDSAGNGNLATQGNTNIIKVDSGLLSYQVMNPVAEPGKEQYNTLNVPAGGQYKLVLPDGSKVWLNAGSSLTYPTVFGGKKRAVSLTGEGYFEVTKDPMYPFEVTAGANSVQVLGTHFNINAYSDEPVLMVTLAEGSVRVNDKATLRPGEQAQVNQGAEIKIVAADLEKELAWKNGLFIFKQTQLDEVMRQVGRWYNCEVKFEATISDHFNASISRDVPVSNLLSYLEGTGRVHFQVEDKKITVMQ